MVFTSYISANLLLIVMVVNVSAFSPPLQLYAVTSTSTGKRSERPPKIPIQGKVDLIHPESPSIFTIDNLLSSTDINNAVKLILDQCNEGDTGATTSDYQEDIFRAGAEEEEDEHFTSAVDRAGINMDGMPLEYSNSPLESFLWVITNHPSAISEEDIISGANFIKKRQARQKWESDGGRQLLELSMDEEPFEKAGKRYEMPDKLRVMLLEKVVDRILASSLCTDNTFTPHDKDEHQEQRLRKQQMRRAGIEWRVQDATVVIYDEGESQVPHFDPCDATILVYLDDGIISKEDDPAKSPLEGGDTCFPLIGRRIPVEVGKVLLFFSSTSPSYQHHEEENNHLTLQSSDIESSNDSTLSSPSSGGERDVMALHHGGRIHSGRKIVAQIMLDAEIEGGGEMTASWANLVPIESRN